MSLFFSVDWLFANRISSLLVNMEVAIGDDSYFKTGRWIKQVGVVHLKSRGRCGNHNLENNRSETEMVRPCGEKDWRRCSNENMEDGSRWTSKEGRPKRRWSDAPTPNRENVKQEVSYTFYLLILLGCVSLLVIVVACTFF